MHGIDASVLAMRIHGRLHVRTSTRFRNFRAHCPGRSAWRGIAGRKIGMNEVVSGTGLAALLELRRVKVGNAQSG
jgi:hypothetical protein